MKNRIVFKPKTSIVIVLSFMLTTFYSYSTDSYGVGKINVVRPTAGEYIHVGDINTIEWYSTRPHGHYKVSYWDPNIQEWTIIEENINPLDSFHNTYSWNIPFGAMLGVTFSRIKVESMIEPIDSNYVKGYSKYVQYIDNPSSIPVSGVNESDTPNQDEISLFYPNPAANHIVASITANNYERLDYEIVDYLGNLVVSKGQCPIHIGENKLDIGISEFKNGVYLVKIKVGTTVHTQKIVVYH